jgi:hypothetical protein
MVRYGTLYGTHKDEKIYLFLRLFVEHSGYRRKKIQQSSCLCDDGRLELASVDTVHHHLHKNLSSEDTSNFFYSKSKQIKNSLNIKVYVHSTDCMVRKDYLFVGYNVYRYDTLLKRQKIRYGYRPVPLQTLAIAN